MAILHFLLVLVAVLLGFVGLIVIIKGFVDKNNKRIWLGTILVSIMLVIAVSGVFCVGKRVLNCKRNCDKECTMMIDKCMKSCDPDMMKGCDPDKMKAGCCPGADSTEKEIVTRIIVK